MPICVHAKNRYDCNTNTYTHTCFSHHSLVKRSMNLRARLLSSRRSAPSSTSRHRPRSTNTQTPHAQWQHPPNQPGSSSPSHPAPAPPSTASSQSCTPPPGRPQPPTPTNAPSTTTDLTTSWSAALATFFSLPPSSKLFEYALRAAFFGLNLLFNAVMWGLFTRALTLASSTVRVSVINTSANFVITAVMSALVFGERLPGLWWVGAAMLVAGSVIVGLREQGEKDGVDVGGGVAVGERGGEGEGLLRDAPEADGFRDEDGGESRHELGSVRRRSSSSERSDEDGTLR